MSNFKQNTVETVGDSALAESIINRSITELQDNITTSIAAQKFRGCSALANVIFPSVASVGIGAFWQCTALKQADFTACVSFAQNAFYGCSAMAALILRCTDAVCTLTGNLSGTPIATGAGYIYVPLALVDTYKAATGWSTYAAQIRAIEDYPEVCDPYTWEAVFKAIDAGTYKDVYAVGDLVPLDLGSEGLFNMQIAAFDADDLADGTGKAPISWVSKELRKGALRMNPELVTNDDGTYQEGTGSIGGWEKCEMRSYIINNILPLIPQAIQSRIRTVSKTDWVTFSDGSSAYKVSQNELWIPSSEETDNGNTYPLFGTSSNKYKRVINQTGTAYSTWWLRSGSGKKMFYIRRYDSSNKLDRPCTNQHNIALGFCT